MFPNQPLQGKYRARLSRATILANALDSDHGYSAVFFWKDPASTCHHATPGLCRC